MEPYFGLERKRRTADRIVTLAEGRIMDDGPAAQILDHPTMPRTRQFLSQALM